jgi:hypothetical protein
MFTLNELDSSSDEQLFALLGEELERRVPADRNSPEFLRQIGTLPIGLRAMAATYELDVSLALDDLGWHFGNWHSNELSEETATGLEELGATELAKIFRQAYQLAMQYWEELGSETWMGWYHGSEFEHLVSPLDQRARSILDQEGGNLFKYWVDYARRHPERIGVAVSQ